MGMRSSGVTNLRYVGIGLRGTGTAVNNGSVEGCETDDCGNMVTGIRIDLSLRVVSLINMKFAFLL